jgi:signal transduction histidine kinase
MLTTNYERKTNDLLGLPEDYGNLGISFYDLGKYDSAYIYFKLAEKIALDTKNNRVLTAVYNNLGKIASDKNNFNLSIQYLTKSIQLNNESKNIEGLGENYIIMGDTYKKAGNKTMAIDCYNKGIEYCKQSKFNEDFVSGYYAISKLYEETGDIGKALSAYKMYVDINDTLVKRKYNNQVAQWQTLYELKNKEFQLTGAKNELTIQNIEIQKNKLLQRFLLAIVGIIALIFILVIRNIHHKRVLVKKENEIQKHKINELENERLLLATQSVLKGEDSERKRLARDLHDGLGGLLSGVKIALNNMKGNVVLSSDSVNDFNQALGMLDSSITELRRVAHNMMPEALMKLGLKDTLTDFCYELGKVNPMQIDFQFYGQFERVESNLEINIYRIIQELVNNAIKHADAKELVVQMIQEPKRLCFIVLDNGKGFELKEIEHTKGMGLASIKSRVDSFKGKIEIISKPGKGTEITIEFLI